MDFDKLAEEKIREAMERGEFDGLGGEGKKIDLTEYFNTPAEFRVGHSLLRSNKFVPSEVTLMREIAELIEQLKEQETPAGDFEKQLQEKKLALSLILERNHRGSRRR